MGKRVADVLVETLQAGCEDALRNRRRFGRGELLPWPEPRRADRKREAVVFRRRYKFDNGSLPANIGFSLSPSGVAAFDTSGAEILS
jgi:hypothetical protein